MNLPDRCPHCNTPLAPTTGQPMCPVCLLRGVLQRSDSQRDDPFLTETRSVSGDRSFDSMRSIGASTALADLQPGTPFGDYRIVRRLGHGGMGVVYEAEQMTTSRRVALKVLAQSLDQGEARARFMREGRLAAAINHPNSVYVYGTEEIDGVPTISMELVDGGTLAQRVKQAGPMSIRDAVDAVIQIVDGLEAADERGVLHRDVKPSNCFITSDGAVKIGDFGLSISTAGDHLKTMSEVTIEGTFLGTPAFASPEQLRGEPLDRRSDIYSVGVTLFYLLTGKVPFDADNMIHLLATVLDKSAPAAATFRSDIPDELDAVIQRCLQKPAGQRFDSYESLRQALRPFSSRSPVAASLGDRTLAGIVDTAICWVVLLPISFFSQYRGDLSTDFGATRSLGTILLQWAAVAATIAYFAIAEWKYGYTIGKKVLGLRVTSGDNRPTLSQTIGRAFLYLGVPVIPSTVFNLANLTRDSTDFYFGPSVILAMMVGWSYFALKFGLFVTARANNGYAAIHDQITSTRVLEFAADSPRRLTELENDAFDSESDSEKVGPYIRLRTLFEWDGEQLVLGYDAKLLRRVWLHLQPIGTPMVPLEKRDSTSRETLRWLGGRRTEAECWDCYEAPPGRPLIKRLTSISGSSAIRLMRRLVDLSVKSGENDSGSEKDLNRHRLERWWATDLDDLKWLPFDIVDDHADDGPADGDESTADPPSKNPSLSLVRRAASCVLQEERTPTVQCQSWSLEQRDAMIQVSVAQSPAEATQILHGVDTDRAIKLRARVLAMVAVSLSIPLLTVVFGLFAAFLYEIQKQRYPEVDQLHEVVQVLRREEELLTAERVDRLVAVQRYVAGNFKHVFEDKDMMNSIYATVQLTIADRIALRQAIDAQQPTAEELRVATERYDGLRQDWIENPGNRVEIQFSFWTPLGPAYTWLEFIWLPSLLTGLLFRGGLLMRLFGLVLVNRRGKRASGLRVFIRMLIGGLPVLVIVVYGTPLVISKEYGGYWSQSFLLSAVVAGLCLVAVTMVVVPFVRGNQCFSDRFSGTYLMVR
ncbi:Serine/threonine-protein kinase PrkC [Stieleria maiorica]|uniref:Serine/threonine-protein kinase PrkC n=1 Tax=Stieleria maiorica TaxID=2795974 RepID=A0A5B9MIS2_9BACT|nr:protein kinase [Stieleria maiorica]QEG01263.1 Serine/threonine-protein kinase PrkC [Stieleria maiorica]